MGFADDTYDWKSNDAISKEVVVQAGQIRATSAKEFDGCVRLYCQRIRTFNNVEEFLLLLLELIILTLKMFDDSRGAVQGSESGNVMERRVFGEKSWVWRS